MKKTSFKFSIISAVYNSEKYLDEMIESVIGQTIGFEENVQLILVNDGSTDNSDLICKKYERKYPNNIKYFEKENGGPSTARNLGLNYAEGQYINFLDSDDALSDNALRTVLRFFNKHHKTVDIVTLAIEYFEKKSGLYPRYENLDHETCIVNLNDTPKNYINTSAASFYKASIFKKLKFNTNIKVGEDFYLNCKIFIDNPNFGYISSHDAVYNYRVRYANDSIMSTKHFDENWLVFMLEYIYKGFNRYCKNKKIDKSFNIYRKKTKKTELPCFIKYILISEIIKRIKTPNFISKDSLDKFFIVSKSILSNIEDEIIMDTDYDEYYILVMLFMLKAGDFNVQNILTIDTNNNLKIGDETIENIENYSIKLSSIKLTDDDLYIQGYFNDIIPGDFKIYYKYNRELQEVLVEETDNVFLQKRFFDKTIAKTYIVTSKIPLKAGQYYFILKQGKNETILEIQNIYGDEGILINTTYCTKNVEYDLNVNIKKIILSEKKNKINK